LYFIDAIHFHAVLRSESGHYVPSYVRMYRFGWFHYYGS